MRAVVSDKGQVTIPKPVRTRLGITQGSVIEFEAEEGRLVGVKQDTENDPVAKVTGIVRPRQRIEAYLNAARGPAE